ncbi:hypothetical protein TREMEDRAFT_66215 [Tremella mesenterica DSM 1558]|uniref:uncharacterized protein n=1 Tax=Tremella mesenterica (strain ATCC 24925 / CBS 8224 / DSM 1558 / NBRC 9311 / NRRL Y-6157 / RJB 2259-6 / UBC 559-6) TaxID=578456 RepID=UPI00032BE3D1|nr:uncharacterized protein TREMEDRAFT_66215 [Tremella mesenterica DSM 1558]EIW65847.1 hypothetical protein TREMEDRAFT_66215 [Tremella mesenterica DSM 1558]
MSHPIFKAEPFFHSENVLAEGILWDSKTQLLHWVDIETASLYTLDIETKQWSIDKYPESQFLTSIALRKDEPGLVATNRHSMVILPTPTPVSSSPSVIERKSLRTLCTPLRKDVHDLVGFNDGACDPQGRYLAGSMNKMAKNDQVRRGELIRYSPDGTVERLLENIGLSNGIGFSLDHKTMYYIDSQDPTVDTFSYPSTGLPTDRKQFIQPPPPSSPPKRAIFDGMCLDGIGNLWVARWNDGRIIGYTPEGKIICEIHTIGSKSPTICCFGGKDLDKMFIVSAHTSRITPDPVPEGEKEVSKEDLQNMYPHSGDVMMVDFAIGTEIRKVLGEGWKGAERYRFAG